MSYEPVRKRRIPTGFGKRLEQSILDSGLTYIQIEKISNLNHTNIYAYVQETMIPNSYTLYLLCKTLNVSADYLLGLSEV